MADLLSELVYKTHATKHGNKYYTPCPVCGAGGDKHYFSQRGYYCWICDTGGGIRKLAEHYNIIGDVPVYKPVVEVRTPPAWRTTYRPGDYNPGYEQWYAYKRITPYLVDAYHLHVGVLPASKCKHNRLIVPIYDGNTLVCLRGRSMGCDCGKWLASGGFRLDELPLFGMVHDSKPVWVVENPIDAVLMCEHTQVDAVATLSCGYWNKSWTEVVSHASHVVVAFDNDLPGNGGAERREEFIQEWLKSHHGIPKAHGPERVRQLRDEGIDARLFNWRQANYKDDIGSKIVERIDSNV